MKAILINANEQKVVAADVKPDPNKSLDGLRALIGCEWVQPVVVGDDRLGGRGWVAEAALARFPTQGPPHGLRGQRHPDW